MIQFSTNTFSVLTNESLASRIPPFSQIRSLLMVYVYLLLLLHFYVGSMYDGIRLHVARSYTSSSDSPFSLISSFTLPNHLLLGLPLFLFTSTFHYHRPPSYVVFVSSHHMPIPLQPSFLYILCDFPHFRLLFFHF